MKVHEIKLLSFDLDGTLLGNREATRRFRESWENLPWNTRPYLCYNTGRLFEDTLQVIESEGLPSPDFCICGVGTLIYDYNRKRLETDFADSLQEGWNLKTVSEVMNALEGTVLQPMEFQNAYKSSWYMLDAEDTQINAVRKLMRQAGLNVNVVYSSSRDLDILPRNATKGNALSWLINKLGIQNREVVVGGDTGNDSSMFLLPGVKGIIVANAMAELMALSNREGIYTTSGMVADGILEGLEHFGVLKTAVTG